MTEYLDALYPGTTSSRAQRKAVASRLSYYLGIPERTCCKSNLRVPYDRYQSELLRGQDMVFGRLDSRYTTYGLHQARSKGRRGTRPIRRSIRRITTAINEYLRKISNTTRRCSTARISTTSSMPSGNSRAGISRITAARLRTSRPTWPKTMTQNPTLKVFSANGYYDFATPFFATVYTLQHLEIAPPLQKNITYGFYESGHMVYLNAAALAQFKSDLSRWYDSAMGR